MSETTKSREEPCLECKEFVNDWNFMFRQEIQIHLRLMSYSIDEFYDTWWIFMFFLDFKLTKIWQHFIRYLCSTWSVIFKRNKIPTKTWHYFIRRPSQRFSHREVGKTFEHAHSVSASNMRREVWPHRIVAVCAKNQGRTNIKQNLSK